MKTRHKLFIAGGVLLLALIAAPLVVTLLLDQAYYKTRISDAVERATGRPLIIDGDLQLAFGFKPRILAHEVKYPNADWGSTPWAVRIGAAEFTLDLSQLLRGRLQVANVSLRRPQLHIEKKHGVYNLATGASSSGGGAALPLWLNVAGVEVIDGDLSVVTRNRHWDFRIARGRITVDGRDKPVTVEARGALEDTPVEARATLGSAPALFARRPSALRIDGWLGDASNRVSAAGRARDLLRWRGVDLQLDYRIARLPALSKLFGVALPAIQPFAGHAAFHQPDWLSGMQLRDIEARTVQFGLRGVVTGAVAKLYHLDGLDLRLQAAGDLAHPLGDWAAGLAGPGGDGAGDGDGDGDGNGDGSGDGDGGRGPGPGGAFATTVTAALRGSVRDFDLRVESAAAENAHLALRAAAPGVFNRQSRRWRGRLPLELTVKHAAAVAAVGAFAVLDAPAKRALAELPPVTATAVAERTPAGVWHLRGIEARYARDQLLVEVRGGIEDLTSVSAAIDGRLTVSAQAADGEFLQPWLAGVLPPLPPLSDFKARGEIAFTGNQWRADVARLAGRTYGIEVAAAGPVGDLRRWRGVDLAVTARAEDLSQLPVSPAAQNALAGLGALRASARLADDPAGAFHLSGLRAETVDGVDGAAGVDGVAGAAPVTVRARGNLRHLGPDLRAAVAVTAQLDSLQPLAEAWPALADSAAAALLERALPLRASGMLHASSPTDWGLRDIAVAPVADSAAENSAATADSASPPPRLNAALSGAISRFRPLDARLHFTADGVALASLPAAWNIPRPRGGELAAALDLAAAAGRWRVENLRAAVDHAAVKLTARGGLARLNPLAFDALDVEFSAPDWLALNWFGGDRMARGVPVAGRVTVSADAAGAHAQVEVEVGGSDARGVINWRPAGRPGDPGAAGDPGATPGAKQSTVAARPRLDATLDSTRLDLREIFGEPEKPSAPRTRLFSPHPINIAWMRAVDADIELRAGALATRQLDLRDAALTVELQDGVMRQSAAAGMGAGTLTAAFAVDANARPLRAQITVDGKQLDTANVVAIHKDDFLVGGAFDLAVELRAAGDSSAALAASAGGEMAFELHDARMKNQSLDIIGGDIFSNLVTAINPFRSIGEYVAIECAIARFDIDAGVATIRDRLAVKTDRVTLSGGGHLDLGDETMKIVILPRARKGFGINTASLAKIVRLGGSLAQPKIEADASRLLQTGAEWLAAVYSAGWSLIAQGLFDRIQANTDVCGQNGAGGDGDTQLAPAPGDDKGK